MGSQRHRVGKTSTFLHISPLILAWVSPQEIQCTRPFVLNFHWMFLGKDVCSRRPSPMASKCPIHGKSILRSHQLEPQIAAGIMEPPKGTRRIQMGWTPTRSLRTTGTHLYSASGFSLSRGQGDRGGLESILQLTPPTQIWQGLACTRRKGMFLRILPELL